jgi:hypothetical protein
MGDPKLNHIPNMLERYSMNGNVCKPLDNIDVIRARVNEGRRVLDI